MRRRLGDRREHLRFEVAGHLWASVGIRESVVLRNIGIGGALIETRLPQPVGTVRTAQLSLLDRGPELEVIVRHVEPLTPDPDEQRYRVGVEFVNVSPVMRDRLKEFVLMWSGGAEV